MTSTAWRKIRTTPGFWAATAACSILLMWAGITLYQRWFGITKEEKRYRAAYTSEYAQQPKRQEALSQWMSQGIIKAISKNGRYAEIRVGPAFYKYDPPAQQNVVQTVFDLYIMEDKSFRDLAVLDAETGNQVASCNAITGFHEPSALSRALPSPFPNHTKDVP